MKMEAHEALRIEKVLFSKNKREVKRIYTEAFEKEERMPFLLMLIMSCLWNTQFLCFYDGEVMCGFVYLATIGRQTFIMFFAVEESLRSKGYGGRILQQVQSLHPKNQIIVSIEPCTEDAPNAEIRRRRKAFYGRNGYLPTGYMMKLMGIDQEILVRNGVFNKRKFITFFMLYSNLTIIPKITLDNRNNIS